MTGRLRDIPPGERVFVDANTFVYHFTGVSGECTAFLRRCERGDVAGITGVHVLLELVHRLMMVEAVVKGLVSPGNVARKLREHPDLVQTLSQAEDQAEVVTRMGIGILPVDAGALSLSRGIRTSYRMMVNDSVTAALARREGIEAVATSDRDFLRVPGLRVYSPGDLDRASRRKG